MRAGGAVGLALALLLLGGGLASPFVVPARAVHPADAGSPITIELTNPSPGSTIRTATPTISASFSDSDGTIDVNSVIMLVDGRNVTGLEEVTITPTGITYAVPIILSFRNGDHMVNVTAADDSGHEAKASWTFTVNTAAPPPSELSGFSLETLVLEIAIGGAIVAAGVGGYVLYLRRTRNFTFRKYFATHPVKKEYVTLYVPAALAFVVVVLGLLWVTTTPGLPLFAPEYVVMAGLFVALTAYAIDARREKQRIRTYERAFAQFLFEMADAMRGGIDPAKAVVELSKSSANILRKPLRIAADGILLGRPFDEVLRDMVAPMKSPLVSRYAQLITEASSIGGETSAVVYRAAKDLDDFLKIDVERVKQLMMPVAILYVAFGVLAAVLFALLYIAPTLGSINVSFFGTNPLATPGVGNSGASGATVPKLDPTILKQRFFDLLLIVSLGTGAIIGAFTEGKARYGLLHSLALMLGTAVAFAIIFPG
ncbi:MAG TPA: type II secretion system F family protein [Thermoplasmata archaeon]|nr:type II secretion system F family protein [Thermoplasmata archaeon]